MMKFSYSDVWNDMLRLLRGNGGLIASIAGVFVFLPLLLLYVLMPPPPQAAPAPAEALGALTAYWQKVWYWLLLENVVAMIGNLAVLRLVLARGGATVGEAIVAAFVLLPAYLVAAIVAGAATFAGFLLLIVPGLYVTGRLAPLPAVIAGERLGNPLEAIRRTLALTRGRGWAIFGLILLIGVPAWVSDLLISSLCGILFIGLAGPHVGGLLALTVTAAASAAISVLLVLLYAALYGRLSKGI
jgi:hypothetical protein